MLNVAPDDASDDWCLRCHRSGHRVTTPCPNLTVERAVPKVQRDWNAYYRPNTAALHFEPVTVVDVINISHRLSLVFNQFNGFVTERDPFLHQLDKYLKSCLTDPCYEVWMSILGFCNTSAEAYINCLLRTVNKLQDDVVLGAMLQVAKKENRNRGYFQGRHLSELSERECTSLMDCTRRYHVVCRISKPEYSMILDVLNSDRAVYMAKHREALRRIEDLIKRNRDALDSEKIRVALSNLSLVMLDPGRSARLNRISPMDFPLPRIRRLREGWNTLNESEK